MEAIISHSGRQFKVKEGATIEVDLLKAEPGSEIELGDVLYVAAAGAEPRVGTPTIAGARVLGKVLGTVYGEKLIAAQFRRRKNSRRRVGHRQPYTRVVIEKIQA
jgi:large subunit ribosomal protein L21